MHRLLQRQLKRYANGDESLEKHNSLFKAISDAYSQNEQELEILESSLFITSNELNERNATLNKQLEQLADTQQQLEQYVATLKATFDATGEYILVFDKEGNLAQHNKMGIELFGLQSDRIDKPLEYIKKNLIYPDMINRINDSLDEDPIKDMEGFFEFIDGRVMEYHSSAQLLEGEMVGRVWCLRDVTEQKKNEELVHFQAFHDALTGLPNRHLLIDRLEHAISICDRKDSQLAVMFVDLDNFKKVNDVDGHSEGDQVLQAVTKRLNSVLRNQDSLSRHGGDEFVLVIENVTSQATLVHIAQKLCDAIAEPIVLKDKKHFISCSIGISNYPEDDTDPNALIRKADMAMYRAKEQGKNTYQFFSDELEVQALKMLELERKLHLAIENQQLTVYFQPEIALESMQIVAAEALVRWVGDDGRLISPEHFIPLAEQSGLINKIGSYVFDRVCQKLKGWLSQYASPLQIAVNLSPREFIDPDLVKRIKHTLETYDLEGQYIILEITESLFLEDKLKVSQIMGELKSLGIKFALDDFGSGYASFDSLQALPIDYLKVDKRFLQDVVNNPKMAAIARSIIQIGKNLDLQVISEGIENAAAEVFVKEANCDLVQGYYYHRPLPEKEFECLLESSLGQKLLVNGGRKA
jgi:diguanylate cyclase (GGDEF)-like protein/PAS domain S-box-containing protein